MLTSRWVLVNLAASFLCSLELCTRRGLRIASLSLDYPSVVFNIIGITPGIVPNASSPPYHYILDVWRKSRFCAQPTPEYLVYLELSWGDPPPHGYQSSSNPVACIQAPILSMDVLIKFIGFYSLLVFTNKVIIISKSYDSLGWKFSFFCLSPSILFVFCSIEGEPIWYCNFWYRGRLSPLIFVTVDILQPLTSVTVDTRRHWRFSP